MPGKPVQLTKDTLLSELLNGDNNWFIGNAPTFVLKKINRMHNDRYLEMVYQYSADTSFMIDCKITIDITYWYTHENVAIVMYIEWPSVESGFVRLHSIATTRQSKPQIRFGISPEYFMKRALKACVAAVNRDVDYMSAKNVKLACVMVDIAEMREKIKRGRS